MVPSLDVGKPTRPTGDRREVERGIGHAHRHRGWIDPPDHGAHRSLVLGDHDGGWPATGVRDGNHQALPSGLEQSIIESATTRDRGDEQQHRREPDRPGRHHRWPTLLLARKGLAVLTAGSKRDKAGVSGDSSGTMRRPRP